MPSASSYPTLLFALRLMRGVLAVRPLVTATLLLLVATCGTHAFFDLDLDGTADVLPRDSAAQSLRIGAFEGLNLSKTRLFVQQGIDVKDIDTLKPYHASVVMAQPNGGVSWSFLPTIDLVAQADGLPELVIAHGEAFVDGSNMLGLQAENVELKPYARRNNFRIFARMPAGTQPPQDTTLRVVLRFQVGIGQPGAACWQK